jgi:hypothetical protein
MCYFSAAAHSLFKAISGTVYTRVKPSSDPICFNCSNCSWKSSRVNLEKKDADPTLKTLEAYAEALGKKLLIVLTDAGDGDDE